MRILLLANQPERTTRLLMFKSTLERQGHEVIVPQFGTRDWLRIARKARKILQKERPDAVHLFNVPDIVFHGVGNLKGDSYQKLIYDYRSPWGVELQMSFGRLARLAGEHFESELARSADLITAVNRPLADKVCTYLRDKEKPLFIVNNYPARIFLENSREKAAIASTDERPLVFMGRISRQEGIGNLLRLIRRIPEQTFWIIGDGPFSRWYFKDLPKNARFFGWQPHDQVGGLIRQAKVCLIPHSRSLITPYATDKSVWKLNEYLLLGKIVVASGVTLEEKRKNLLVVDPEDLEQAIRKSIQREPERLQPEDYRFWERNDQIIKEAYECL